MNEKIYRRLILGLSLLAVLGIAGTLFFGIRSADDARAYRELIELNRWIDRTRDGAEEIKLNLDRIVGEQREYIGELEENNRQLRDDNILLIDNNRSDRAELRKSREYIDGLESNLAGLKSNNAELETVLLGILSRNGFAVHDGLITGSGYGGNGGSGGGG